MQTTESQHSPPRSRGRSFDSLTFAKRLQAGGVFTREQAEVLAEEQAALIDERLATKEDIAAVNANVEALRLSTKADIESLRLSTKADIAAVNANIETTAARTKAEILKWMFGQTIVIIAAVVGLLRVGAH